MRVLIVHNFYQQPGGEDEVFRSEVSLLRSRGHDVAEFTVHNDDVAGMSQARLALNTVWNRQVARRLRDAARRHAAEVVHFHNTFPLVSPAGYAAARDAGAGVVQTLHNFRPLCPAATFFRDGGVCEDCLHLRVKTPAIRHACYRGDRKATAALTVSLGIHHLLGTYGRLVDRFLVLSPFMRDKFVAGGFDADQLVVKPNFVEDVGAIAGGPSVAAEPDGVLFVGRLTEEKGVHVLREAWRQDPPATLTMIGDGPLAPTVRDAAATSGGTIRYLGRQPASAVQDAMRSAGCLAFPSLWYEGMPRTMIEAFAARLPVVCFDLGTCGSMIQEGLNGNAVRPVGDVGAFRSALTQALRPGTNVGLRAGARASYERLYTPQVSAALLESVYRDVAPRTSKACPIRPPLRDAAPSV